MHVDAQLIDRCVRELKVETDLISLSTTAPEIAAKSYKSVRFDMAFILFCDGP